MTRTSERLLRAVAAFPVESRAVAWGRSLIALAQLSVVLLTPANYMFVPVEGHVDKPDCTGVRQLTAYCLGAEGPKGYQTAILVVVFALVIAGVLPRWIAPLHWWATVSLSSGIALPDGGEAAAQVVTFWLMVVLIADRRRTHWAAPSTPRLGPLQAVAWAGGWGLRLQVAYIYLNAAIAKLSVEEWQEGSAVYYVVRGEYFGAPPHLESVVHAATAVPAIALLMAWGTIATELAIAVLLLQPHRPARSLAAVLCVLLHGGILVVVGLWSFAFVMVGACVAACAGSTIRAPRWRTDAAKNSTRPVETHMPLEHARSEVALTFGGTNTRTQSDAGSSSPGA